MADIEVGCGAETCDDTSRLHALPTGARQRRGGDEAFDLEATGGHRAKDLDTHRVCGRSAGQVDQEGVTVVDGQSIDPEQQVRDIELSDVADELLEFINGAELVIHNAEFDVGFIEYELGLMQHPKPKVEQHASVLDTLTLARRMHPGQRNSLDALCKRYEVDASKRDVHGALIDSELLANVYLAMTGGQVSLSLGHGSEAGTGVVREGIRRISPDRPPLPVIRAAEDELAAHEARLAAIDEASGGRCLWLDSAERNG